MKTKKRTILLSLSSLLLLAQLTNNGVLFAKEQNQQVIEEVTEIWNERYKSKGFLFGKKPLKFLKEKINLLPRGNTFMLAMGEGRNAVYLAQQGFYVEGCDISEAAIDKAHKLATKKGVRINAYKADLAEYKIKPNHYDLITCFYYLQRDIIPQIIDGLRIGGMVIFETYNIDQLTLGPDVSGPRNKDYLLKHNELLNFFKELRIIFYEECIIDNKKAISRIIAQKVK